MPSVEDVRIDKHGHSAVGPVTTVSVLSFPFQPLLQPGTLLAAFILALYSLDSLLLPTAMGRFVMVNKSAQT